MFDLDNTEKTINKALDLGINATELAKKMQVFLSRTFGVPIENAVGILGDKIEYTRCERQKRFVDIINEDQQKRGLTQYRTVPPKFAIPIISNACWEEDDYLQDIWCKLLTNYSDPAYKVEMRTAFTDILKSLTALDARILQYIYDVTPDKSNLTNITDTNENKINTDIIIKNIDAQESEIYLSLFNLKRVQCVWTYDSLNKNKETKEAVYVFNRGINYTLTPLGCSLVEACMR